MAGGLSKRPHNLTELEWRVRHAAQDMDRHGIYPTGDRLVLALEDDPEPNVRRARHDLISWGLLILRTPAVPPDRPFVLMPEPVPEDDELESIEPTEPKVQTTKSLVKQFNINLWRIIEDKGSTYEALGFVLGMSANAVKCRVDHARHAYPSEELEPCGLGLSHHEKIQIRKQYGKYLDQSHDPAVRIFAAQVFAPHRARPDSRSRTRDMAQREHG